MRVLVRHGHFAFYPSGPESVSRFNSYYGVELVPDSDFYTFPALKAAPDYSLPGAGYLGVAAVALWEGPAWEVMRENGFVYSLDLERVVAKSSISSVVKLAQSGFVFTFAGFLQPGSRTQTGSQILSYDAVFRDATKELEVSRVGYE